MSILTHESYRTFLKDVMAEKAGRNPAYSLRAMARSLDLAPSYLSTILKGEKNLSAETAARVTKLLDLEEKEADYFCLLVQKDGARSAEAREAVLGRIERLNPQAKVSDLSVDHFRVISDWYHFATLAALELGRLEKTPKALAHALGVSQPEVEMALVRLERLEMVEKLEGGTFRKTISPPRVTSVAPSEAIRNFHRQSLQKAAESLETQNNREKMVGSETFPIDEDQLPEFHELCEEFFQRALALSAKAKRREHVYHLGVQLFNFTPNLKPKKARKP